MGIRTEATANVRPVILPPLLSILIILMIPRTSDMAMKKRPIRKVRLTQPVLMLSIFGNLRATMFGIIRAQPQKAKISEMIANLLIVTVTSGFDSELPVIEELQKKLSEMSSCLFYLRNYPRKKSMRICLSN